MYSQQQPLNDVEEEALSSSPAAERYHQSSVPSPDSGGRSFEQHYCVDGVCVTASNNYERTLGRAIANGLFEGIILEVYQKTWIEVLDQKECELKPDDALEVFENAGCVAEVMATKIGPHDLKVRVNSTLTVDFSVVGKYVRREIRDLDFDDRTRFFDAIAVTHTYSDEVGVKKFGENYRSTDFFASLHAYYSADRQCDHWHSGPGFVNQHLSFTLRFEHALQAVDPRTCVHYWDYTIDYANGPDCCWTESALFTSDFFSHINPNNTHHIVDKGRWAYTRIHKSSGMAMTRNAYGLLSVPWNTDKTPFVTRSNFLYGASNYVSIPSFGCERFRSIYKATDSFQSAANIIDEIHSPVHGMVGGYWNYLDEIIESEDWFNEYFANVSSATNAVCKKNWRWGYIECPDFCSADQSQETCRCGPAKNRIEAQYPNATAYEFLNGTGTLDTMMSMSGGWMDTSDTNSTIWDILMRQVANVGHIGTATSDSSPNDPIFWVIHGMQDRYMQMVRFLNDTGELAWDQSWGMFESEAYDWSNVTSIDDVPTRNTTSCSGHYADDLIIYPYLLVDQPTEYVSNVEYWNMTKAFSPHLQYVYDQLLNWTQCGWKLNHTSPYNDYY